VKAESFKNYLNQDLTDFRIAGFDAATVKLKPDWRKSFCGRDSAMDTKLVQKAGLT